MLERLTLLWRNKVIYGVGILYLFFGAILVALYGKYMLALVLELIILTMLPIVSYILKRDNDLGRQMCSIIVIFLMIWIGGIYSERSCNIKEFLVVYGLICLLLSIGILIPLYRVKLNSVIHTMPVFVISAIYILLSVETVWDTSIFDSGVYYALIARGFVGSFDFTFNNVLTYCLANHVSFGYAIFALIGELFFPQVSVGVHIVHIVLAIVSIFELYSILVLCFGEQRQNYVALCVYAFSPFILGTVGCINIDFVSSYLFVIMFSCLVKKKYILFSFWSWVFVCTKEPNIVCYAFLISTYVLTEWRSKQEGNRMGMLGITTLMCQPIVFFLLYFFAPERGHWLGDKPAFFSNDGVHTLGFTIDNFLSKILQIFGINFNWIFVLIVITYILLKKRDNSMSYMLRMVIYLLMGALLGYLVFNWFYLDYQHPRYVAPASVIFLIIGVFLWRDLINGKSKLGFLIYAIAAMLLLQSFCTIDPLMRRIYMRAEYGNSAIALVACDGESEFHDSAIYNREYKNFIEVLERVLKKARYNSDMVVVFPEHSNIMYGYTEILLWDLERECIVTCKNDKTIEVQIAGSKEVEDNYSRVLRISPKPYEEYFGNYICESYRTMTMYAKIE